MKQSQSGFIDIEPAKAWELSVISYRTIANRDAMFSRYARENFHVDRGNCILRGAFPKIINDHDEKSKNWEISFTIIERFKLRRNHQRCRQIREIACAQRGCVRMVAVESIGRFDIAYRPSSSPIKHHVANQERRILLTIISYTGITSAR
jgi:hypothetical protein